MQTKNITEIDYWWSLPSGSEAEIHRVKIDGCVQFFKKFHPGSSPDILNRKQKKLERLITKKEITPYYPKLYFVVRSILDEYMAGYTMERIVGVNPSEMTHILREKIEFLKQMRTILELFMKNGVFYVDIHDSNILIKEDKSICFLDIDNIGIDEYQMDLVPSDLKPYLKNGGKLDKHAVIANFNLFSNEFLGKAKFYYEKEGADILGYIEEMKPDTIFDHEYLYEYIKIA